MNEEVTNQTNQEAKKKKILPFIITVAVALIVLIVGICIYNTPANRIQRQLDLGNKYLEEENYEQAIVEFDKAIAIDPMSVEAYLGKAEAYEGMGDMDMALQTLEEGYAQTGNERLREKIEEINNMQSQQESDDIIEFSFELEDITIMGYDLFTDHYEDICAAYGCPVDMDLGKL